MGSTMETQDFRWRIDWLQYWGNNPMSSPHKSSHCTDITFRLILFGSGEHLDLNRNTPYPLNIEACNFS